MEARSNWLIQTEKEKEIPQPLIIGFRGGLENTLFTVYRKAATKWQLCMWLMLIKMSICGRKLSIAVIHQFVGCPMIPDFSIQETLVPNQCLRTRSIFI